MVALAALTWLACSGEPARQEPAMPEGWPDALARDPTALQALVDADADGWIGLHGGGATPSPGGRGPASRRALAESSRVEAALAGASASAWARLLTAWTEGPGLPPDSALPALAALAAGAPPTAPPPAVAACAAAHAAARHPGEVTAACPSPLVVEADGARRFDDPMVHRTRARLGQGADADVGGLAAIVFSGAWAGADRAVDGTVLLDGPTLSALGLELRPGSGDDPDRVRAAAAGLDRALQRWQAANRDAPGAADVEALAVVQVFRGGLLAAAARAHLDADQPHAAAALLLRARDLQAPRTLGPANRAEVLALTAWAAVETGRTREALDALAPLRPSRPHIAGLISVVEDLAVLEGMRRSGDSRER